MQNFPLLIKTKFIKSFIKDFSIVDTAVVLKFFNHKNIFKIVIIKDFSLFK